MITYFMCREFYKSGEFDDKKNPYAGIEIRVPFFILLDVFLILKGIELIKNFI